MNSMNAMNYLTPNTSCEDLDSYFSKSLSLSSTPTTSFLDANAFLLSSSNHNNNNTLTPSTSSNSLYHKDESPIDMIVVNRLAMTWDCSVCHRSFKEKNDIDQHLRSGVHAEYRLPCSLCDRTFGSTRALNLHLEQSSHTKNGKSTAKLQQQQQQQQLQVITDSGSSITVPSMISFGGNNNNNSAVNGSNYCYLASNSPQKSNFMQVLQPANRIAVNAPGRQHHAPPPPPQQQPLQQHHQMIRHHEQQQQHLLHHLFVHSHEEMNSLAAGCCFILSKSQSGEIVSQDSFVVNQVYPNSLQADFEALIEGLRAALIQQVQAINVVTTSQLVFTQLKNGDSLPLLQSTFRESNPLLKQVRGYLQYFAHVKVDFVPPDYCVEQTSFAKQALNNHSLVVNMTNFAFEDSG